MTEKRFSFDEFSKIIIDILNKENGINTRRIVYIFREKTGKDYDRDVMRRRLHHMVDEGLIKSSYDITGFRWWRLAESKQLKKMQEFLESLGLKSKINNCDGRLYCLEIKEYYDKIIQKSEELGITFIMEQTPYYGPINPHTGERKILGFIKSYYFEDRGNGDVE